MTRRDEVAERLAVVRRRIATACSAADRDPDEVTLVVVTKFFPESDVRVLADLGVRHVGENRHQEAEAKHAACADLDLVWHFIGGLQSNKAAAVGQWADVVQSVAVALPPYHFVQLALGTIGASEGGSPVVHAAAVLGFTLLFLVVAAWGFRRDEGRTYG